MSRIKQYSLFATIAITTVVLVVLGLLFAKSAEEKINWLAEAYDVSDDGRVVFIKYAEGKPGIFLNLNNDVQLLEQITEEKEILDVIFSPNGEQITFSITDWEAEELVSEVYTLDVATLEKEQLFEKEALVTELQYDPKDEQKLYYLMAKTHENYSSIARAYPHSFDIYHFDLEKNKHFTHTNLQQYAMTSLQVSDEAETLYVQMDDDFQAETAEEIFETKQRIFEFSLEKEEFTPVTNPKRNIDVFDFALIEDAEAMIFQSIANYGAGDTFEYELYYYDWAKDEETQLTQMKSFASRPVFSAQEERVYFIVDHNFGKSDRPRREIYSIDVSDGNVRKVISDISE